MSALAIAPSPKQQVPAAPAASKVPRDSKKLEKVEKAEKLDKAKPKARKGLASLDVSRWADLEEEDEFQEVLAAKLGNAKPSTAAEAPAEAANTAAVLSEEVEAVEADPEPDRPKRKAKAKKPREGGVRKDETPNPLGGPGSASLVVRRVKPTTPRDSERPAARHGA
ncbi:unnamed protein product, partial [Durusdinium trenchii]